jgi:hypothetical protein
MTLENTNHELLKKTADILILNGTLVESPGLIHGKMGIAVFFFHYAKFTDNELFEDYAMELIEEIRNQIHVNSPANYETGLAGIGVGIDYLIHNDFLEADEDIFEDFDKRMYRAVMYDPLADFSLYTGLSGQGRYWLCRLENDVANEVISHIITLIENSLSNISKDEQIDIYCFLSDLCRLPLYTGRANKLMEQCQCSEAFTRFEKCDISKSLDRYFGKKYFAIPLENDFYEILRQTAVKNKILMGLFNGYAGYGLCQLTAIDHDNIKWMNLL